MSEFECIEIRDDNGDWAGDGGHVLGAEGGVLGGANTEAAAKHSKQFNFFNKGQKKVLINKKSPFFVDFVIIILQYNRKKRNKSIEKSESYR